eukprot:3633016-Rhodomonas_salina.2
MSPKEHSNPSFLSRKPSTSGHRALADGQNTVRQFCPSSDSRRNCAIPASQQRWKSIPSAMAPARCWGRFGMRRMAL